MDLYPNIDGIIEWFLVTPVKSVRRISQWVRENHDIVEKHDPDGYYEGIIGDGEGTVGVCYSPRWHHQYEIAEVEALYPEMVA